MKKILLISLSKNPLKREEKSQQQTINLKREKISFISYLNKFLS